MRFVLAIFMVVGLAGCSLFKNAGCDVSKALSTTMSGEITKQLTCKNTDAIKASLDEQLVKLKVCEKKEEAVAAKALIDAGTLICAPVVEAVLGTAVAQIPTTWECSGAGPIPDKLRADLLELCKKAF